jgi:hypothetical protein
MASASIYYFIPLDDSVRVKQYKEREEMKALRIFMVMTLGAVLVVGLFACGGDGDSGGSSSGNSGGTDYSQYSGVYTVNFTITDSSDSSEMGRTGIWTARLNVTPYGYATFFYPNSYCGEVISSGILSGSNLAIRTGAEGWKCGYVTCCDGLTSMRIRFTDTNSGTLTRTSTSCCSANWQKSSGTFTRQ